MRVVLEVDSKYGDVEPRREEFPACPCVGETICIGQESWSVKKVVHRETLRESGGIVFIPHVTLSRPGSASV